MSFSSWRFLGGGVLWVFSFWGGVGGSFHLCLVCLRRCLCVGLLCFRVWPSARQHPRQPALRTTFARFRTNVVRNASCLGSLGSPLGCYSPGVGCNMQAASGVACHSVSGNCAFITIRVAFWAPARDPTLASQANTVADYGGTRVFSHSFHAFPSLLVSAALSARKLQINADMDHSGFNSFCLCQKREYPLYKLY